METTIETIPAELMVLKQSLGGKLSIEQEVYTLALDAAMGSGFIRYDNLKTGLKAFYFDITLKKDIEISLDILTSETMQFLFCLEGFCHHQFNEIDDKIEIESLQSAMIHSDEGLENRLLLNKEVPIILTAIFVNKREYFDRFDNDMNTFDKKIQKLLHQIDTKPKHLHLGSYNLKIAEQVKLLNNTEQDDKISEYLANRGRYYLILAKHIEQLYQEINENENQSGLLKQELKQISEISEFIKEQPEIQHSIKTLCIESGLSPAKLQEGFKFMFERTVSDFVRNVRIEKAEHLIKTTDLNISEVVYSIGLTSRSYFCKIFKKKYHCSPKEYKTSTQIVSKNLY